MYGHERLLNKMKAKLLSLFVVACLLPTLALAGQRSEPRSLYQRPDGEWFLCRGQFCDQPIPPPAWAPLPERQQHQRGDRDQDGR
jgi:hypothetical protein